jgi:hypothetical protein
MSADEGAELRDAHRAETALERALLTASAAVIDADKQTVAAAVRLLRAADDNGTTRLEVRDQSMTRRRWFDVNANGEAKWGDR